LEKKYVLFLICLLLGLFLFGCSQPYYYSYDEQKDQIEKIEIIDIQEFYPDKKYDLLKTLSEEEMDELLSELSNIEFIYGMGPPNTSPEGFCLKLYYKNGEIGYINYNTSIKFNAEGSRRIFEKKLQCPEDNFNDLLSKYIELG
jgi:hypothetical protein